MSGDRLASHLGGLVTHVTGTGTTISNSLKERSQIKSQQNFNVDNVLPFYCRRVHKLGGPKNTEYKLSQSSRVQYTRPIKNMKTHTKY